MLHFKQIYKKAFSLTFTSGPKKCRRNVSPFGLNFNTVNRHLLLVRVHGRTTTSCNLKIPYKITNALLPGPAIPFLVLPYICIGKTSSTQGYQICEVAIFITARLKTS